MGTVFLTSTMGGRRVLILFLLVAIIFDDVYAKKKKKPCKFAKKKYKAGEVIEAIEDNCVELKCSDKGKNVELAVIEDCSCGCDGGPNPTGEPTEDPGTGGGGGSDCNYDQWGSAHTMNLP